MDDFERELTRMMREGPAHTPFAPGHRARLYDGIREGDGFASFG